MDDEPADLVISYTVSVGECGTMVGGSPRLDDALARGYRVLDVIATACGEGATGFVCVTVVLTLRSSLNAPYKTFMR